jgi:hypothetical protein
MEVNEKGTVVENEEDYSGSNLSLDDLLGMGSEELGKASGESDEVSLKKYGEVADEPCDFPHFKVPTKRFLDTLRISNIVSQGSGRDIISKSIGMEVKGGDLQIYLTDFDIFVEKSVEILNEENILEDFIVVNLAVISKQIGVCTSVLTIYKKENKYYLRLQGGDMELETLKVEKEQLMMKDRAKFKKSGELVTEEFYHNIKNLFVLANAGVTPAQRRIFFKDDKVMSVFLYCVGMSKTSKPAPDMDVKIKDVKILYTLATGCDDTELIVSKHGNRVLIEGGNFMYSFLLSDSKPPKQLIDSVDMMFTKDAIEIDYIQLCKWTNLSADLMYSTSRLDFNYTADGKVGGILRTKREDTEFTLGGIPNPSLEPLKKPVSVQSSLLKVLLKIFNGEDDVSIVLSEQGIGMKSKNYTGVLFTEET